MTWFDIQQHEQGDFLRAPWLCDGYSLIFVFVAQCLPRLFTVLAFRHCVTHVGSAGRLHSLYSRSLFFSSGPFLLLLSYFLLWLGKSAADCTAVENHGENCDAMILAAPQAIF